MRQLDTRSLQMFVAVALCLNFRQAAEQLHMTQPPLSRAIRELERRLKVRLFERDTQGVALTAAARQLLPLAQRILALLGEAENALARHAAPTAGLRLGLTSSVEAGLFGAFGNALGAALGEGALELSFAPSPRLIAAVRARRLDAALIALPGNTQDLTVQPLGRQALMVAIASAHPLARRHALSLAHLNGEPVYWFERARQPAFFDHCHAVFERHGFAPAFVREPDDHHVLLAAVAAGKGVALLPDSFRALRLAGVSYRKLAEGDALGLRLALVTPAAPAIAHPAALLLAQLAQEQLGQPV